MLQESDLEELMLDYPLVINIYLFPATFSLASLLCSPVLLLFQTFGMVTLNKTSKLFVKLERVLAEKNSETEILSQRTNWRIYSSQRVYLLSKCSVTLLTPHGRYQWKY